jgi:hypothetical protein
MPATSVSSAAASNMPRYTDIGPPGSANALMSFRKLPVASLAPERRIGIDRRGAAGGQVAGEKRGAD